MSEPIDEIGTAIPFDRFGRVRLELAFAEVQRAPAVQQLALVEREAQRVLVVRLAYRCHGLQIGEDCVRVFTRDLGVLGNRHCGVEQGAVRRAAGAHHLEERFLAPCADAVLRIRCDVRRIERTERRIHGKAAGEQFAARRGVAGDAVAGARQILAAFDDVGAGVGFVASGRCSRDRRHGFSGACFSD